MEKRNRIRKSERKEDERKSYERKNSAPQGGGAIGHHAGRQRRGCRRSKRGAEKISKSKNVVKAGIVKEK